MKNNDAFRFRSDDDAVKCPQCSSLNLESSNSIKFPEWKPGRTTSEETKVLTSYQCQSCGERFTSKDIDNRKTFNQGMSTLFVVSLMIILLLIVLL